MRCDLDIPTTTNYLSLKPQIPKLTAVIDSKVMIYSTITRTPQRIL